jgi:ribonuclease HII
VIILGVDEVGRGCLAGPVVAGAVILDVPIAGLKDSKKLSELQRQKLNAEIGLSALSIGIGWASPKEIDALGLTAGVRLAMQRAISKITDAYDKIIIDGNYNFFPDNPKVSVMIRADDLVPVVSAASIVAKVARDNYMCEQSLIYPAYAFDKHVGYGTKFHLEMLKAHGVCELHRLSCSPVKLAAARL